MDQRPVYDSTSAFRKSLGDYKTEIHNVPHHRVLANYWLNRHLKGTGGMLYGDSENEFVCMLQGLEIRHRHRKPTY